MGDRVILHSDINCCYASIEHLHHPELAGKPLAVGGELISQIIENWEFSKDRSKHFILQPMTKSEELMRWLFANGFSVIKRDCCTAANKCYTVILAEYSGEVRTISESDLFLYGLDPKNNSMHRRFIEGCVRRLLKQAKGNPVCAETARILEESFK